MHSPQSIWTMVELYPLYLKHTILQVNRVSILLSGYSILVVLLTDVIMDMLGNPKLRQIITESYQLSEQPMQVRKVITDAR